MTRLRFPVSLTLSVAVHALLGLLLYFDVVGAGGGFGLGSGPGFGIGQGGGFGLGKGNKRQIYALQDFAAEAARPRKGKVEDRLASALEPQALPRSALALAGDLAIALPKAAPLPPSGAQIHSDLERKAASGAMALGGLGGAGGGGGLGVSLGGAFGRYVSDLREKGLDVVFVVDGTASMQDVIDAVRRDLGALVDTLQAMVPVARIGFVVYRDRTDDKPIELAPLTASRKKLDAFLKGIRAEGGGDWPESLNLGIGAAWEKMQWRSGAKRLIVFVASSPPHDDEREPTIALARVVREAGGAVSAVDLSAAMHEAFEREFAKSIHGRDPDAITPLPGFYHEVQETFGEIVAAGGGELIAFHQNDTLVKHLLVLAFGTRWKEEVKALAQAARPQD